MSDAARRLASVSSLCNMDRCKDTSPKVTNSLQEKELPSAPSRCNSCEDLAGSVCVACTDPSEDHIEAAEHRCRVGRRPQ